MQYAVGSDMRLELLPEIATNWAVHHLERASNMRPFNGARKEVGTEGLGVKKE